MKKIVTVIGARPQFIKASALTCAIRNSDSIEEVLVHTGQHFDENMSDIFFEELGIKAPHYSLDIHGGRHGSMTGRMLIEVEEVLLDERPELVLVYGDTNSTLVGALAAAKLNIPVAHIEAGLRSFNMSMPEEINRILTDRISRWLFTPSPDATAQLLREGVPDSYIKEVGDVMYDVALLHGNRVNASGRVLGRLGLSAKSYVLATIHRAQNTDNQERLLAIIDGLQSVAKHMPVVLPLHPRTRYILQKINRFATASKNIHLIEPLSYLNMVQLEKYAAVIATDSGGVQKESFFFHVPCITLREETEWRELVQAGWNYLVPPTSSHIVYEAIMNAIGITGKPIAPYGKGDAAQKILDILRR